MWRKNEELDKEDHNCPLCGRVLLECISGESKRFCSSCNEEFKVKKVG